MNAKTVIVVFGALAALVLGASPVFAQDDGDLNVTMKLMSENAQGPDAVTRELELPRDAPDDSDDSDDGGNDGGEYIPSQQGVENSQSGLDTANAARENGRAFGQEARALADENRERFGRGGRGPNDPPNQIPDDVPVPDNVPPQSPPGRP